MALLALAIATRYADKLRDANIWYHHIRNCIWPDYSFLLECEICSPNPYRFIELQNVVITFRDGRRFRNIQNMEHFIALVSSEDTIEIRQITNDEHGFIVWKWKPIDDTRNTWICTLNDVPIRTAGYAELQKMFQVYYFYAGTGLLDLY